MLARRRCNEQRAHNHCFVHSLSVRSCSRLLLVFVNCIHFLLRDLSDFRRVCQQNWMTVTWQRVHYASHPPSGPHLIRKHTRRSAHGASEKIRRNIRLSENLCCENWCTYIRWSVYLRELRQLQIAWLARRTNSSKTKWHTGKFFGNRHNYTFINIAVLLVVLQRNELKW